MPRNISSADDEYILRVSNLSVKLQNQVILNDVSFYVKKGTTLAILGPNGAGKSVLFKTLLNLLPYTGKIQWMSKVRIGYVPQNISVSNIPISVKEFLSIKDRDKVENALALVRLNDKKMLNKSLEVLSSGQLRRVLIAWALIDEPDVLLFDEPTTGVDIDNEEPIYRMLDDMKWKQGITILLITHDVHIVKEYSDYLLALNKCVTFFGESKMIMNLETQRKIFGEPVCVERPTGEA